MKNKTKQLYDQTKKSEDEEKERIRKENPGKEVNEMTELMKAAQEGSLEKTRHALENHTSHVNDLYGGYYSNGTSALVFAAQKGHVDVIKNHANVNHIVGMDFPHPGKPVLGFAIDSGSLQAVKVLLEADANVHGVTEVFSKSKIKQRSIPLLAYAIIIKSPINIIQALIDAGGATNWNELIEGWTPYKVAVEHNYPQAAELLKPKA